MGKKFKESLAKVSKPEYSLEEASALVKDATFAKFDESVEIALCLGVDPKRADQMVRGTTVLPHGTGKKIRILVIAKGEKERELRRLGQILLAVRIFCRKSKTGGWISIP